MKGPGCCQNIFIMLFLLWKRPGLLTDRGREVGGKAGARESGRHEESELQDLWVGGPQVSFAWCLPLLERCVDGQILITTFSPQQNLAVLYSLSLSPAAEKLETNSSSCICRGKLFHASL